MSRFAKKQTTKFNPEATKKYQHGFSYSTDKYAFISKPGLSPEVVKELSKMKGEPKWMLDFRLKALEIYRQLPMPNWGADLSQIEFEKYHYYLKPTDDQVSSWEDVPAEVKQTFEKIGIPQAERATLAGVKAQYDS